MVSFPDGDTWSYPISKYKPKPIPNGVEVVWVRLIKEYDEEKWKKNFPKDLNVGDVTWIAKRDWMEEIFLIEDNRYGSNFCSSYFELIEAETPTIKKKEFNPEPHYEVY